MNEHPLHNTIAKIIQDADNDPHRALRCDIYALQSKLRQAELDGQGDITITWGNDSATLTPVANEPGMPSDELSWRMRTSGKSVSFTSNGKDSTCWVARVFAGRSWHDYSGKTPQEAADRLHSFMNDAFEELGKTLGELR